jgi:hypothetical protein
MRKVAALLTGILLNICFLQTVEAQVGGQRTFSFLELTGNAKQVALGGVNVSSFGHDVNMVSANPALLNPEMKQQLSLSYTAYLASINQSNLAYVFNQQKSGLWAVGLSYLNYGEFIQRDATGIEEGNFSVNDYALSVSHARQSDAFTIGATAKIAVSNIAGNKSVGLLADVGGIFRHPEEDLTIGLTVKNVGYQVKPFDDGERAAMPFDAQLGISYKPEHMPVRLSITAHHLYQFDIVYLDPNTSGELDGNGNKIKEEKAFGDKLARHFVVGAEFIFSQNFQLRAGYNHLRRKELSLENRGGAAGLSLGAMLRVRAFELNYGAGFFHAAGGSHTITLSTNTSTFLKKKDQ